MLLNHVLWAFMTSLALAPTTAAKTKGKIKKAVFAHYMVRSAHLHFSYNEADSSRAGWDRDVRPYDAGCGRGGGNGSGRYVFPCSLRFSGWFCLFLFDPVACNPITRWCQITSYKRAMIMILTND